MNRRNFLSMLGAGCAAAALPGCASLRAREGKRPNVVYIIADDPGYNDFGYQVEKTGRTPYIDSLSANGTRFSNAYTTASICSPSRAGIMTGRYQNRFGYEYNPAPLIVCADNFGLPVSEVTMGDVMKSAGYATGYVGKWHLGYNPEMHPQRRGFDEFFGFLGGGKDYFKPSSDPFDPILRGTEPVEVDEYLTYALTREAVDFVDRKAGEAPFFLMLSYTAVHIPPQATEADLAAFPEIEDEKKRILAAMAKAMDDGIGELLAKLREKGVYDDTLVIFIGDNGGMHATDNTPLRKFKFSLYEGGLRVPFVMQWPSRIPSGQVYDPPVSAMDVYATAAAAAGASVPDDRVIDGVNLLPYITGKASGVPHEALYWRWGRQYVIRKGDWKLIRFGDKGGRYELYNLADDISETHNVYESHRALADELEAMIEEWDKELAEPLWSSYSKKEREAREAKGFPWKRDPSDPLALLDTEIGPIKTR